LKALGHDVEPRGLETSFLKKLDFYPLRNKFYSKERYILILPSHLFLSTLISESCLAEEKGDTHAEQLSKSSFSKHHNKAER
jgi:hypothetical protein